MMLVILPGDTVLEVEKEAPKVGVRVESVKLPRKTLLMLASEAVLNTLPVGVAWSVEYELSWKPAEAEKPEVRTGMLV